MIHESFDLRFKLSHKINSIHDFFNKTRNGLYTSKVLVSISFEQNFVSFEERVFTSIFLNHFNYKFVFVANIEL